MLFLSRSFSLGCHLFVVLKDLGYFCPYLILEKCSKLSGQCFCEVHRAHEIVVDKNHPPVKICDLQNKLFLRKVE